MPRLPKPSNSGSEKVLTESNRPSIQLMSKQLGTDCLQVLLFVHAKNVMRNKIIFIGRFEYFRG
jgi:hypothetical protein